MYHFNVIHFAKTKYIIIKIFKEINYFLVVLTIFCVPYQKYTKSVLLFTHNIYPYENNTKQTETAIKLNYERVLINKHFVRVFLVHFIIIAWSISVYQIRPEL